MSPFTAMFVPDELAETVSDHAWLRAMLDAERALAVAEARAGVISAEAAAAVALVCDPSLYDATELAVEGRASGNPAEPLVRALRARLGEPQADWVHRGATSQDIVDTAAMLVAQSAARLIDGDLGGAAGECARLADEHRAHRDGLAHAAAAGGADDVRIQSSGLARRAGRGSGQACVVAASLPAQLGGAAGTLAALGDRGVEVLHLYAEELGLREPAVPWHTSRAPVAELAGALAGVAAAAAKIAGDVVLLAQTEVAEVAEHEPGGSSTMPHKRNPVGAVLAIACERHSRANAGILLESAVPEHERAVGAWHAEWHALAAALAATGGAVAAVRRSLTGLEVDARADAGQHRPR